MRRRFLPTLIAAGLLSVALPAIAGSVYQAGGTIRFTGGFSRIGITGTPLSISFLAPTAGQKIFGDTTLTALLEDNGGSINGVQFGYNGTTNINARVTAPPYSTVWDTTAVPDGSYPLFAAGEDTNANFATSTITVEVQNNVPVIFNIASSTLTNTGITITWNTSIAANSVINYGTTSSYGSSSSTAPFSTSHSITLSGLATSTLSRPNQKGPLWDLYSAHACELADDAKETGSS